MVTEPAKTRSLEKRTYFETLSAPKQSKAIWLTSFGPNVMWGNQEPMSPISLAALKAVPTQRLCELAKSKKDHQKPNTFIPEFYYSCGRTSQIWRVNSKAMTDSPSERICNLSRHKTVPAGFLEHRPQYVYSCGRSSPIWQIEPHGRSWSFPAARPRTADLARPKQTHPDYRPNRQVDSIVSEGAKSAIATGRLDDLATPKSRLDGPFRDPQWAIPKTALQALPTERVMNLAKPKKLVDGYQPCRDVVWRVSTGARNAVASNRLGDLARPIVRDTMDHVQFNPDAFNVSEPAKKAKASARIEELAQPVQRGV